MLVDPKILTRQYQNGKAAAKNKVSRMANPFNGETSKELYDQWDKGWCDICFVDLRESA